MYLTKEPNVYEAMALVHSRVRRVVFGVRDRDMGGLGGTSDSTATNGQRKENGIHALPGTNHHYRAFRFDLMANCVDGHEGIKKSLVQLHQGDT